MEATIEKKLLTEHEAARYLGISAISLRKQRHYGAMPGHMAVLPFVKLGKRVRYKLEDLDKFIEASTVIPRQWSDIEKGGQG